MSPFLFGCKFMLANLLIYSFIHESKIKIYSYVVIKTNLKQKSTV